MIINLKNFDDFKDIVNNVNLVVFYKKDYYDVTGDSGETITKFNLVLYVVDNNSVYGYRVKDNLTDEEVESFLSQFNETREINSIE